MKFRVQLDQRNAIRGGYNLPSSATIDVDVSKLHASVRYFIADRFWKGWIKASPVDARNAHKTPPITVLGPEEESLVVAIRTEMEKAGIWTAWTTADAESKS